MTEVHEQPNPPTTLNVLLVEDNYEDMELAAKIILRRFTGINLYKAGSRYHALRELSAHDMDLLILDIKLPDGTGFDVAKQIRNVPQYRFVHIIFITGNDYDPLETYSKYHCYSFITKPYTSETITRQLAPLIAGLKKEKQEHRVPARREVRAFSTVTGELVIPLDDILYAELRFRNIVIHTEKGDFQTRRMSIKAFMEYVDDPDFVVCHESFVVNMSKVMMIEKTDHRYYAAVFDNGDRGCMVSQKRYPEMKELLDRKVE